MIVICACHFQNSPSRIGVSVLCRGRIVVVVRGYITRSLGMTVSRGGRLCSLLTKPGIA